MAKDLAVIVVHGMGDTKRNYDSDLKKKLRDRLGDARWQRIAWIKVYYQAVLQENQERVFRDSKIQSDIDWLKLRKFVLFGFSDAASMESKPYKDGSIYQQIQQKVLNAIDEARIALEDPRKPILIIAHSLGCQVMSNFIWDAQQSTPESGVFRPDLPDPIGKQTLNDQFRRLKTLRSFITSGCNIPIFVAGRAEGDIKPILVNSRGWRFRWENYFDPDDVLGWPLQPLSPAYKAAVVVDKPINAGGPLNSWTPMSHSAYWTDSSFLRPVTKAISTILGP